MNGVTVPMHREYHKLKNVILYQMNFQISYHVPKGDVRKHEENCKEVKATNSD